MAFPQFVSVAEDLQYLRNEWASGTDDATLRRGTAILRRLLVDKGGGVLLRIWRATGFEEQPTVTAADLDALLGGDYRDLAFAAAGGAKHEGMWIGCVVQRTRIEDGPPDLGAIERSWPLRDYVEAPCAAVGHDTVNRREVIKYFAHYQGGVHLQLSSRARKKEQDMVRRVERLQHGIMIGQKNPLYFELLSIGQALGKSEDLRRLENRIMAA